MAVLDFLKMPRSEQKYLYFDKLLEDKYAAALF